MANPNTLEHWRPHPFVYFHCLLAILLLAAACSWGIAQLIAWCCQPEGAVKALITGLGLFIIMLWFSFRRCSTSGLPAFRGLLLMSAYMTIGMGSFSLLIVIPAVAIAIVAIISIALVGLFLNDAAYAKSSFGISWTSIGSTACTSKKWTSVVKSHITD